MSTMDDEGPAKHYAGEVAKLSVEAYKDENVSDALDACLQKAVEHFHILVDGTYLGKLKQMRGMLQMRLEAGDLQEAQKLVYQTAIDFLTEKIAEEE